MKKLLIILLPVTLFLVSCGGGEGDLQPVTQTLEETIVGKKWCLSNEDEDGFILSPGGGFFTTKKCTPNDTLGSWIIDNNLIKYSVINNSIQTTSLWGEVSEYSSTQVKVLIYSNSTTTTENIYSLTGLDVYGCMDTSANNYNPLANCDDFSCVNSEIYTYLNDVNFEQRLIQLGYDNVLDGKVLTINISSITHLRLRESRWGGLEITDLTGIEDFTELILLYCIGKDLSNKLTNIDLSNNTKLRYLNLNNNLLTNLDVSNNTSLIELSIALNQVTNLDISNNTSLTKLYASSNQLTNLDISNNISLTFLDVDANQLSNLDVSNNILLEELFCNLNQLTNLDLSANTSLEVIYCNNNQLTSLDLSTNTLIEWVYCSNNQLSSLDLKNNTSLKYLSCGYNNIISLELRNGNNYPNLWIHTISNPLLNCIEVDYAAWSTANWTQIDPQHYFSENCP